MLTERLDALIEALAPHPVWIGGAQITVGESWRYRVQLSGCGQEYLGTFNDREWFVDEAFFADDEYPDHWPIERVVYHAGPADEIDGSSR